MTSRITETFNRLKQQQAKGLITFFMANDPTPSDFEQLLNALPDSGVDLIEVGMPFSDAVADGVAIQAASQRAIANNTSLQDIFKTLGGFRKKNQSTPVILMGYINPILHMGYQKFFQQCATTGVDGVIIVDLPPEEEADIRPLAQESQVEIIRLITPTTEPERLEQITRDCGGFIYFVSVSGITGTKSADIPSVEKNIKLIRQHSDLPIAVGFGIKDSESAKETARVADAIVIGSALVDYCYRQYKQGKNGTQLSQLITAKIAQFKNALS